MKRLIVLAFLVPAILRAQVHSYKNTDLTINWPNSKFFKYRVDANHSADAKDTMYTFGFSEHEKAKYSVVLAFEGIGGPRSLIELLASADKKHDIHDAVTSYCLNGRLDIDWSDGKLVLHANLDNGTSGSVVVTKTDLQKLKML